MSIEITIPFARPSIGDEELHAITKVLQSRWLTTGNETLSFEMEFADFLQAHSSYTLAVQSATAGLHLAYQALGAGPNHSVIASPLTFISSISMAIHCGAQIEFIDCAPNSLYPNATSLEALPHAHNQRIITLNPLGGYHTEYENLIMSAQSRKLLILEDAAHAFPANTYIKDTLAPYGTIGDIGVYSFYANKTITTGEGGMIVSSHNNFLQIMSLMRNHGMDKGAWSRFTKNPSQSQYDITTLGYKYNMPDILACIGRIQLKHAHDFHKKRIIIAQQYLTRLAERDYWILPPRSDDISLHSWHLFILQITHPKLSRGDFMEKLAEKGIGTSIHYTSLHLMSYFKQQYGYKPEDFPNALEVSQKVLSIPIYPELPEESVHYICDMLIEIGDKYL